MRRQVQLHLLDRLDFLVRENTPEMRLMSCLLLSHLLLWVDGGLEMKLTLATSWVHLCPPDHPVRRFVAQNLLHLKARFPLEPVALESTSGDDFRHLRSLLKYTSAGANLKSLKEAARKKVI